MEEQRGKNFCTDAAPSGRVVSFTGEGLCDYTIFGYAAFLLWVSNCPFFG